MNTLPAMPGTYLLEREQGAKEARKIPVIGFLFVQAGPVYPLCAIAHGGLTRGRALLTADGFVTDPSFGVVCGNVDEWMKLSATPGYWTKAESTKPATAPRSPVESDDAESATDVQRQAERPPTPADNAAPKRIPDKPTPPPQEFINATFWSMPGSNAIFKVEGGAAAPGKKDARFEKIKRDDFMKLKKAGSVLLDDWQSGVVAEPGADEDEDAADVGDGSNLI